jgi:hypothetical protein
MVLPKVVKRVTSESWHRQGPGRQTKTVRDRHEEFQWEQGCGWGNLQDVRTEVQVGTGLSSVGKCL